MRRLFNILVGGFLVLFSIGVLAAEPLPVKDGDTVTVEISARELTRIAMTSGMRIDKVWGGVGMLEIQPDMERGEIFIKPVPGASAAMSFFVRDSAGSTYTIVATQKDVPSKTVMLKALKKTSTTNAATYRYRNVPFVDKVKRLLRAMALNTPLVDYDVEFHNDKVPLWAETTIIFSAAWTGFDLLGEIYTVTNTSDKELVFHESEFMTFGERVKGVAIENLSLAAGETTFLYIIRLPEVDQEVN